MYKRTRFGFAVLALFTAGCLWLLYTVQREGTFPLGIDLRGGTELIYELDLGHIAHDPRSTAERIKDTIAKRLNAFGLKEISIAVEGDNRLVVQFPGTDQLTIDVLKKQVEQAGALSFHIVADSDYHQRRIEAYRAEEAKYQDDLREWARQVRDLEKDPAADPNAAPPPRPEPPDFIVRTFVKQHEDGTETRSPMVLENQPGGYIDGSYLATAYVTQDQQLSYVVGFEMKGEGASLFGDLTRNNLKRQLAIVLDDDVVSAPVIQSTISKSGQITGRFTAEEAKSLVTVLQGGSLPTKPQLHSQETVGSVFGRESVRGGIQAVLFGLVSVMVFISIYYLAAGIVTNFALAFNIMVVLAYVATFRQDLTLPGVAGILLTIGMAVDANILIFERVREERSRGKALIQALATGYRRAFSVIVDSNLTTLITGLVLFNFGSGPVKGFAVTLIAGIIVSFISALFVTRLLLSLAINMGWVKQLRMLEAFKTPSFPFIRWQRPFLLASVVVIIASWVFVVERGWNNYGIDFTGGARIRVKLNRRLLRSEMEEKIRRIALEEPELFDGWSLQTIGYDEEYRAREFALQTRAGGRGGLAGSAVSRAGASRPVAWAEGITAAPGGDPGAGPEGAAVPPAAAEEGDDAEGAAVPPAAAEAESPPQPEDGGGEGIPAAEEPPPEAPAPQEAPLPAREPASARRATIGEDGEEETQKDPAQLVREKLEEAFDTAEQKLLLPPAFPKEPAWEPDAGDPKKKSLVFEVNLEVLNEAMTPNWLKEKLTQHLQRNALFEGIAAEEVELVQKGDGPLAVSLYRIRLTAYEPPLPGAEATTPSQELAFERVRTFFSSPPGFGDAEQGEPPLALSEPFPQVATVGPRVASNLQGQAIVAIFVSILGIIFYISLRFEFMFGVAAIVALVHDVLITLGVMAMTDMWFGATFPIKINLPELAALLTIIGYSINDTIVVFDRVRENLKTYAKKKIDFRECVNMSINQTLTRTIWTSLTTLFTALALLLWGGEAVRGFAFTFTVGLITGTYSSVFVASPVLIMLHDRALKRREALALA
ncbi:MAG: protein translocase subunit SecD [Planctomycetes bacterium]|nr:protein translocase subunit SecD [Planctomycetota bacterium]